MTQLRSDTNLVQATEAIAEMHAATRPVAGRRPERVAAHVPECDPLSQSEELGVDRKVA